MVVNVDEATLDKNKDVGFKFDKVRYNILKNLIKKDEGDEEDNNQKKD